MLYEYQLFWPYSTGSADQGDYFAQLAEMDDVEAVYNYPALNPTAQMQAMVQQTIHGKPMVAGQLYRLSPQDPALLHVLDRVISGQSIRNLPNIPDEAVPYLLNVAGADRLVVHKRFVSNPVAHVTRLTSILGEPEFEDEWHTVYVVPEVDETPEELFILAPAVGEWHKGFVIAESYRERQFEFFGEQGTWYFFTTARSNQLWYEMAYNHIPKWVTVRLDDRLVGADDSNRPPPLRLWVEPGFHTLRFEAEGGCDPYPFEAACIGQPYDELCEPADLPLCIGAGVAPFHWTPKQPLYPDNVPQSLNVQLDHGVSLRGYEIAQGVDPPAVGLLLYWSAEHALPESYALFVHVADPVTGVPTAQYTGYPALLTTEWDGGAAWVSSPGVIVEDLPPGEYAINVGWFIPETGARLGVHGDRPWANADMIHLGMVTVP